MTEAAATIVTIDTEPLSGDTHDVHFNRGAIAAQAFARRFPGLTLDAACPPAYAWLARDLLPALLAFIALATDAKHSLRAAIYELRWPTVLAASDAESDVKLIYHAPDDETGRARSRARPRRIRARFVRPNHPVASDGPFVSRRLLARRDRIANGLFGSGDLSSWSTTLQ